MYSALLEKIRDAFGLGPDERPTVGEALDRWRDMCTHAVDMWEAAMEDRDTLTAKLADAVQKWGAAVAECEALIAERDGLRAALKQAACDLDTAVDWLVEYENTGAEEHTWMIEILTEWRDRANAALAGEG